MRVLDLFSGIGGFSLGLERAGMRTIGFCEIEPYCRAVLRKHWPEVWIHDDIKTLTAKLVAEQCGAVDLICGGFPCQGISCAGKGAGLADERSGLWWEMLRVVQCVRPAWLLIENVPAVRTRGGDEVLGALEAIGYACWPLVVGAFECGAPMLSDRCWIVASAIGERQSTPVHRRKSGSQIEEAKNAGIERPFRASWPPRPCDINTFQIETDGLPRRLAGFARRNALRACGNSVVPQVVELIGRTILHCDRQAHG